MIKFKVDNLKNMNAALKQFLDFLENRGVLEDDIFDSRLVSCELITNVIRHGNEEAHFEGGVSGDIIKITVKGGETDTVLQTPKLPADIFAESGRGLYIIKSICTGDIKAEGSAVTVKIKIKRTNQPNN
ncbi:MAG: ATP-binding protein [Clostridiales bacterium]|nr:ATP-binding protein [Clostridiales bacterium]